MTENRKKIGKKYTLKDSNDNNIYKIVEVVNEGDKEYFKLGPYLDKNGNVRKCLCEELDKEYVEQPKL